MGACVTVGLDDGEDGGGERDALITLAEERDCTASVDWGGEGEYTCSVGVGR